MAAKRDVSPIVQVFRTFLLKRKTLNPLRFKDELSARTQPPPNIPDGPHQKLSANYYYSRDARRIVTPANVLYEGGSAPQIEAGGVQNKPVLQRVPGKLHLWDS